MLGSTQQVARILFEKLALTPGRKGKTGYSTDTRVLRTLMLLDLESHPPAAAIDIVALEIDPAPARITQFSLLDRALPTAESLSTLTARLSALVGESHCGSAVLVDSHEPGAFEMRRFALEETRLLFSGDGLIPDLPTG